MKQKFKKGSLVRVVKDLGMSMSHFTSDCDAIVMYTYNQQYGGGNIDSYCLYIKGEGETSWYKESQLILKEENRFDLLDKWRDEESKKEELESDLDYIFKNYSPKSETVSGYTINALAKELGINNMWGSNGEGYNWYINAYTVLEISKPFLINNDKEGFLDYAKSLKPI